MPHPYTEADEREWIAHVQQDHATGRPRRFAIGLAETDRLIGGVGLDGSTGDESEEPALGYWLSEPYWGNGYAREAADVVIDYVPTKAQKLSSIAFDRLGKYGKWP